MWSTSDLNKKHDKILWSELDWLVNYDPKSEESMPSWKSVNCWGDTLVLTRRSSKGED